MERISVNVSDLKLDWPSHAGGIIPAQKTAEQIIKEKISEIIFEEVSIDFENGSDREVYQASEKIVELLFTVEKALKGDFFEIDGVKYKVDLNDMQPAPSIFEDIAAQIIARKL